MSSRGRITAWVGIIWLVVAVTNLASGFSWGRDTADRPHEPRNNLDPGSTLSAFQLLQTAPQASASYDLALQELQQLESEPLCHQTAAKLLVNNCQLLEGKDDATILTDSGRQIRDFVDAYAASLAICDLERGRFEIPKDCTSFREPVLSSLTPQVNAHLHVSSREIENCLSALGASDSAWNTWISYRHKALRFCEAARVDNEKAESIRTFQRLVKIMKGVSDDTGARFEQHMAQFDSRAQATSDRIDRLSPQLDRLSDRIDAADFQISQKLSAALQRSTASVNSGLENAIHLQRMLEVLMQTVLATNAEIASVHEESIQRVGRSAETDVANVMAAMNAAVVSAASIQNQVEISRFQAAELEHKQENLERGMQRLLDVTDALSTQYDDHSHDLQLAKDITTGILDSLQDTAFSAATVGEAMSQRSAAGSWWPYIWCPAASLVMGSYGLPPSAMRNAALVALGEAAGFLISFIQSVSFFPWQLGQPLLVKNSPINATSDRPNQSR